MKIVLVGATGFVGSHLLPALARAGHECLALTRHAQSCRQLAVTPGVRLQSCDVFDEASLRAAMDGAGAVFSMAGILNEKGRNGKGFERVHVELPRLILQACQATGTRRLVHLSALHAGEGESFYLKTKGEAERMIRAADHVDATLVQPSVIFGAGDSFFNRFAALLKLAPVMPLACPEARMQPVWVGDLVRAMVAALDDPETVGEDLVAVGPRDYSLRELVQFTADTLGLKRRIIGLPDGLARFQAAVMDFVPGKPFSTDNYRSLKTDNTSVQNSLWRFGITPRSIEAEVPGYLLGSRHQKALDRMRRKVG